MKTNMSGTFSRLQSNFFLRILVLVFIGIPAGVKSQQGYNISGEIISIEKGEAIAFANVALFDTAQMRIVSGAASDEAGIFSMANVAPGTYSLQVSALGHESYREEIDLHNGNLALGTVGLSPKNIQLTDVDVISRRTPAKQASGSTTFYINPTMQESSNTGTDILRLLPGVAIDLQQNISLEGSQNILILIDGKERDGSYLSQLPASGIDKVEVISSPPARYDASITGIINVVLTEKKNAGWEGHVYAEIPASGSEVFLTPSYNLNYGSGNFNLFTSYNGDLRRFSTTETYRREVFENPELLTITSTQKLIQKTWSHKFHYGIDWYINEWNELNFYGFYNPFSQELDGTAALEATGSGKNRLQASRNDDDINHSLFNSLWYKHIFNKTPGHELTLEASRHSLDAVNSSTFTDEQSGFSTENKLKPDNHSLHLKMDYTLPIGDFIKLSSGFESRLRSLNDKNSETFRYKDNSYAGYGMFSFSNSKLETHLGMRMEYVYHRLFSQAAIRNRHLLPNASFKYNLNNAQSLTLNYRRSINYPGFYQLNPYTSATDPYTFSSGNPSLHPEIINRVYVEYSNRLNNHFLSARLFFRHVSGAIRDLMTFNPEGYFQIRKNNLGEIYQSGIQLSGAFRFGKAGINPYLKLCDDFSIPHPLARNNSVERRHHAALETGISAYTSLPWDLTASASFQYTSPVNNIQGESFSGALYFLSLEKSFSANLKAGVVSGIPLVKSFTYQGNEIINSNFSHYYAGKLHLSAVPLWIKISYRFSSGEKRQKIERNYSAPERELRKGF